MRRAPTHDAAYLALSDRTTLGHGQKSKLLTRVTEEGLKSKLWSSRRLIRFNKIRIVPRSVADALVQAQIADDLEHSLRLKLGIRWLPPRFDKPSGRPDLDQMRRRDPGRYAALWRGTLDARAGKGALGRRTIDGSVSFPPTRPSS